MLFRSKAFHMLVGMITLGFAALFCECAANTSSADSSKYLNAVREFAQYRMIMKKEVIRWLRKMITGMIGVQRLELE